jgi:type IV pilus assembly protein PilO
MLDKLNNLSMNLKLGIMLGLALLMGGAGYWLMVMPAQAENTEKHKKVDEQEKQNAELRPYKDRLGLLDRDIVELKKQAALYKLIVPDDKDADQFIIQLQEQATNAGISLRKLTALPINNKQYYSELPFGIDIDGPYYQVMNFFDRLARQERYINVEGLKITASKGKGGADASPDTSITVGCVAKTFFTPPPAPAGQAKK